MRRRQAHRASARRIGANAAGHELHPPGTGLRAGHDGAARTSCSACPRRPASAWSTGRRSPREVAPIAGASASRRRSTRQRQGAVDRRELADQHRRALVRKARLIVMDEPTASLSAGESREAVRHHPRPRSVGRRRALRLAPARRNPRALRPRHGVPRRPTRWPSSPAPALTRHGAGRGDRRRRDARGVPKRAATRRPARSCSSVARLARGCRGCSGVSFDCSAARCSGSAAWSAPAAANWRGCLFGADRPDGGAMTLEGKPFAPRSPPRRRSRPASAWCRRSGAPRGWC